MVLLKNDGTLPLKKTGRIALFGGGARRTIKGGTGSGDVNVRHYVNVEEGLENAGFEVVTKDWLDAYDAAVEKEADRYFKELRKQADAVGVNPVLFAMGKTAPVPEYDFPLNADADTAIYVLARISGEGSDRLTGEGDISLTKEEVRDILALNEKYEHFVLVLNTGGMVDLSPVESVPAILLMGQLGTPTGDVLADVLTGKSYPSGKLTFFAPDEETFPAMKLCREVMEKGGSFGAAVNGANEVAVAAFLAGKIPFGKIYPTVEQAAQAVPFFAQPTLDDIFETDRQVRAAANMILKKGGNS